MRKFARVFHRLPSGAALTVLLGAAASGEIAPSPQAEPTTSTPSAPAPSATEPMSPRVAASMPNAAAPAAARPVVAQPVVSSVADPCPAASGQPGPIDAARPRLSNALSRIAAVREIVADRVRTKALPAAEAERIRAQLAREEKTAAAKAGGGDLSSSADAALNKMLDRVVLRLSPPKPAP